MPRTKRSRQQAQTPKQRVGGTPYRSQVALDALGNTDGNRRSTRIVKQRDGRRQGTRQAVIARAWAE